MPTALRNLVLFTQRSYDDGSEASQDSFGVGVDNAVSNAYARVYALILRNIHISSGNRRGYFTVVKLKNQA